MNNSIPEKLPKRTPQWFRTWYHSSFWHFQYDVESRLKKQDKLLWVILAAIIVAGVQGLLT